MSFYNVSHSLEHYIARVFQKPSRLDVIRVITAPVNIRFSNIRCFDFASSKFISGAHMHESSTHRILQTLEPRDTCDTDCLLTIDNRGCLAWLCSSRDSINSSLFSTYFSQVFNWVACSIKSRSYVIACVDAVHLNLLLYHLLGHVTFVSHYVDDDVTARICDMTYHVKDSWKIWSRDMYTIWQRRIYIKLHWWRHREHAITYYDMSLKNFWLNAKSNKAVNACEIANIVFLLY